MEVGSSEHFSSYSAFFFHLALGERAFAVVQVGELFGPVRALAEGKAGELFVGTTKNAIVRASFPDTLTPIVQVDARRRRPSGPALANAGPLRRVLCRRVTPMSCGVWTFTPPWSSLSPVPKTNRFISGTRSPISPCGARPSRCLLVPRCVVLL